MDELMDCIVIVVVDVQHPRRYDWLYIVYIFKLTSTYILPPKSYRNTGRHSIKPTIGFRDSGL